MSSADGERYEFYVCEMQLCVKESTQGHHTSAGIRRSTQQGHDCTHKNYTDKSLFKSFKAISQLKLFGPNSQNNGTDIF